MYSLGREWSCVHCDCQYKINNPTTNTDVVKFTLAIYSVDQPKQ